MSFLNPWLLFGALGAAVPVLLHFFGRRRARRVQFSSLMLIQQAQRERSALMRVRQLLLMILRALAILLLSLALAQPIIPVRWGRSPVLVVLDDTPSLRAMDRLGLAKGAKSSTEALAAAVALVPTRNQTPPARLLTDLAYGLTGDAGRSRSVDNAPVLAAPGLGTGDLTVYFLTDLQRTSWLTPAALPANRHVIVADCGQDAPHRALLSLAPREPTVVVGRPTELVLTGQATTGSTGPAPVRLEVDGRPVGATMLNFGPQPQQAVFEWRPDKAGARRLRAVLPADAMPEGNACHAVVPVRQRLRVLILGQGPATRLLALALAPSLDAPVEAQTATALPATLDADTVIVAQAPTPTELATLAKAAHDGIGLLLLAADLPVAALQQLTGLASLQAKPARPGPLHVGEFDVFRAPLRPFANPEAGDLREPEFRQVPELDAPPTAWHAAARFDDGSVALASGALGNARWLLANLPVDPKRSNLAQLPLFVPLLHRLVGFVARDAAPDLGSLLVGQALAPPVPEGKLTQTTDPSGQLLTPAAGAPVVANVPGFYRLAWTLGGKPQETFVAVNLDPAEGDLRRTTAAEVKRRLAGDVKIVAPGADGQLHLPPPVGAGLNLAVPLLTLVFLLLLLELSLSHGLRLPRLRRRGTP